MASSEMFMAAVHSRAALARASWASFMVVTSRLTPITPITSPSGE